jgi:hypothetical protein
VPSGYWGRKETQKQKVLRDDDLSRAVTAGVKRLRDFQNGDGSWGWWRGGEADLWMTAYVVRGLALAGRAGAEIDNDVLNRGAQFLYSQLANVDPAEREEKGMAISPDLLASVLAAFTDTVQLEGEVGGLAGRIADWIYAKRSDLGATSRALLALTFAKLGRMEEAGILCENLTDHSLVDRENGTCRFGRVSGYYHWWNDAVEATSAALRAYLVVEPDSELIPMMVKWLVANRRGAHWKSTRDTAHAILALCDYLRVSKELTPDLEVTVSVDDRFVRKMTITKANVFLLDNRLTLRGADLPAGRRVVKVSAEGTGNLYFDAQLTVFTREEDVAPAGNELAIRRQAFRVEQKNREVERETWVDDHYEKRSVTEVYEELTPLAPGADVGVGEEVEIVLTVTAKNDYRYLVFEDMKGAGFEPVELQSGHAWSGVVSFRELRDERVVFFCSSLPQGDHELRYRVRAEIPGDFHVMPAEGQAMYLPDIRAISAEDRLTVTEPGIR